MPRVCLTLSYWQSSQCTFGICTRVATKAYHGRLAGGGVLLAAGLVGHALGGALLVVRHEVALGPVADVADGLTNLVGGGLGRLRGHLVGDLCSLG